MNRKTNWALTPQDLKAAMIQIHLNHLHSVQLDMIDEAVENSKRAMHGLERMDTSYEKYCSLK
jgi:hypothetical protein